MLCVHSCCNLIMVLAVATAYAPGLGACGFASAGNEFVAAGQYLPFKLCQIEVSDSDS